jgi:hypothetical protein
MGFHGMSTVTNALSLKFDIPSAIFGQNKFEEKNLNRKH